VVAEIRVAARSVFAGMTGISMLDCLRGRELRESRQVWNGYAFVEIYESDRAGRHD
jgi:hypothetical protein